MEVREELEGSPAEEVLQRVNAANGELCPSRTHLVLVP